MPDALTPVFRWLLAPQDSRTAAALRVGFCLACLFSLWDLWPGLDLILGRAGLFGTVDPITFEPSRIFGLLYAHDSPTELRVWFGLSVLATALAAAGVFSRVTFTLAYGLMILGHERNPYALSGADTVLRQLGIWILFLDTSAAWSVDALLRRWRGRPSRPSVSGWPMRAILLQVVAIYWTSVIYKLQTVEWRSGTAVHYALLAPYLGNDYGHALAQHPLLTAGFTYGALLAEFMVPPLLLLPPTHRWGIALGASLHFGIDLFMNVRGFSLAMVVGLLSVVDGGDWATLSVRWHLLVGLVRRTVKSEVAAPAIEPGRRE